MSFLEAVKPNQQMYGMGDEMGGLGASQAAKQAAAAFKQHMADKRAMQPLIKADNAAYLAAAKAQRQAIQQMSPDQRQQYHEDRRASNRQMNADRKIIQKEYRDQQKAMRGLGAVSLYNQPRYGTKQWWQWYATAYLPQYYNQQQVYAKLLQSPFYSQYGLPITYPQNTNQYPYGGQYPYQQSYPYQQQYQYPQQYYQQPYQYQIPVTPPHYIPYGGTDSGAVQCNQAGGIYDAFNMSCSTQGSSSTSTAYGTGAPPNVVGQTMWSAVQTLNGNGWNVWLLNQDGISGGVPPDYQPNRVQISVANSYVTSQAVG